MGGEDRKKGAGVSRQARLEAELRANLKKRKDQARVRSKAAATHPEVQMAEVQAEAMIEAQTEAHQQAGADERGSSQSGEPRD